MLNILQQYFAEGKIALLEKSNNLNMGWACLI